MSEKLTKEELQKTYTQHCAALGELLFKQHINQAQMNEIMLKLEDFNKQAAELNKETQDDKPSA